MQEGKIKTTRRVWIRLAFGTGGTLFALLLVEIGLRLFGFTYSPPPIRFSFSSNPLTQADPDTGWTTKPSSSISWKQYLDTLDERSTHTEYIKRLNRLAATRMYSGADLKTNNLGMYNLNDASLKKEPGTFRVLCLGASTTVGISQDQNWAAFLQKRLEARFGDRRKVEVLNAGVPGFSSLQVLVRFRRALKDLDADVVVLMVGGNDARAVYWGGDAKALKRLWEWNEAKSNLLNLRLFQLADSLLVRTRARDADSDVKRSVRVTPHEFVENLKGLCEEARRRGAEPLICTELTALRLLDAETAEKRAKEGHSVETEEEYNRVCREVAQELGVPLADVAGEAYLNRKVEEFFFEPRIDPYHAIVPGAKFIAEEIFNAMKQADSIRPLLEPSADQDA